MIQWYVFQSKARKERLLCEQLHIREIESFFPCIRVQRINSRREKIQPYFPGYVFGRVDVKTAGRSVVDWIPGAIRIVNVGGEPVPISDYFIHILRQHLETINASGTGLEREFQPGDPVTIQGGPFAGYEGVFNTRLHGRDRVEVLLSMLEGSPVRLELSIEQVSLQKS